MEKYDGSFQQTITIIQTTSILFHELETTNFDEQIIFTKTLDLIRIKAV